MAHFQTVSCDMRNLRRRLGIPSIALAATAFLAAGCGRHSQSQPSDVATATATPDAPSAATTPDPSSDNDSSDDSTASTNGNGNGNGNIGNGSGNGNFGVGSTGSGNGSGNSNNQSGGGNIQVNSSSTLTRNGPVKIDFPGGGHISISKGISYSEDITTADGVTRKTIKRTDSDGNVTITTTTTDSNGVVISSGGSGKMQTTHQAVERVVAAAGVERVDVNTNVGTIAVVRAKAASQVEVHADVAFGSPRLSAEEAKKFAARFTVAATLSGGTLRVRAKAPTDFPKGVGFTAAYRVGVPEGMSLHLVTSNGAIDVHGTGASGTISAVSSYGSIEVADSGATVDASTSNGSVTVSSRVRMASVSAHSDYGSLTVTGDADKVSATTDNGAVTVRGAHHARSVNAHSDYGSIKIADCSGAVDASTDNGSVDYDGAEGGTPTDLACSSDYGSVKATLGDASALTHARLTTDNGSVALRAPTGASLSVNARTSNGDITAEGFPGQATRDGVEHSFDGEVNGGKTSVTLSSDYGSISIGTR